jgi:hypothetical protein
VEGDQAIGQIKEAAMSFYLWRTTYTEGFCVVNAPKGIEKSSQINKGMTRAEGFPDDAYCRMDPEFPKDIQLSDSLYGTVFLIVSKALKEGLEKEDVRNVEFLPIRVVNHKARTASKDYFIVNPLTVIDCIDTAKSGVTWNAIAAKKIDYCKKLILQEDRVPPECLIFRPLYWPNLIVVRRELADKLNEGGFTGLSFIEPKTYQGMG